MSAPFEELLPGGALLQALLDKAARSSMDRYELASAVGISYPYLTALISGKRPVAGIETTKLRKIAEFLDLSFIQVLMLAEIVVSTDFAKPKGASLDDALNHAIEQMRRDVDWGRVAPSPMERVEHINPPGYRHALGTPEREAADRESGDHPDRPAGKSDDGYQSRLTGRGPATGTRPGLALRPLSLLH